MVYRLGFLGGALFLDVFAKSNLRRYNCPLIWGHIAAPCHICYRRVKSFLLQRQSFLHVCIQFFAPCKQVGQHGPVTKTFRSVKMWVKV